VTKLRFRALNDADNENQTSGDQSWFALGNVLAASNTSDSSADLPLWFRPGGFESFVLPIGTGQTAGGSDFASGSPSSSTGVVNGGAFRVDANERTAFGEQASATVDGVRSAGPAGASASPGSATGPAVTIANGAAVEIDGPSAQSVTFAGATGTLKLEDPRAFTGLISGLTGADAIDLSGFAYGANTTATYLGNATGGTLTVTDGAKTASIALSGNYLSSSWTLSSDDKGGTTVVDPTTPQFPNLLSGYAVRPSWQVAGVDYAVGVPAGTVLKDPSTINIAGVTVSSSNHEVIVNASNVTISGIDFSLDGGWQLIIGTQAATNNVTVTDSNFAIGSNGNALVNQVNGSNAIFTYDTFNGNSLADNLNGTIFNLSGGATIEYCLVENGFGDFIDYGTSNTVEYNVFKNDGQGAGSHPDWLQLGSGAYNNQTFEYNTFIQTAATTGPGTLGLSIGGWGTWSIANVTVAYNTMVAQAGAKVSYFISAPPAANLTGTLTVHDNYIDPTGVSYGHVFAQTSGSWYNNYNLVTAASFDTPRSRRRR
jgi:hypothetical protein